MCVCVCTSSVDSRRGLFETGVVSTALPCVVCVVVAKLASRVTRVESRVYRNREAAQCMSKSAGRARSSKHRTRKQLSAREQTRSVGSRRQSSTNGASTAALAQHSRHMHATVARKRPGVDTLFFFDRHDRGTVEWSVGVVCAIALLLAMTEPAHEHNARSVGNCGQPFGTLV